MSKNFVDRLFIKEFKNNEDIEDIKKKYSRIDNKIKRESKVYTNNITIIKSQKYFYCLIISTNNISRYHIFELILFSVINNLISQNFMILIIIILIKILIFRI